LEAIDRALVEARDSSRAPLVAYQGEPGAFGEEAVLSHFGAAASPVPVPDFAGVVESVLSGTVDFGVLPVENSLVGPVTAARKVLATAELDLIGTILRPIRLCLLAIPGATLEGVRRILSHPVALGQCRRFQAALPDAEATIWYDTAGAARHVAEAQDPRLAAVAGRRAAASYGLEVLSENIEDRPDNRTWFVVVRNRATSEIGNATLRLGATRRVGPLAPPHDLAR
jgi:prephenate dehydratase